MRRLIAVALVLAACSQRQRLGTHTIEIRGMAFHPDSVAVALGDTVSWINQDIVPHTATSVSGAALRWDTGQLAEGATGRFVARSAGTVRYTCTLHPTMHGVLVIQ